MAEFASSGVTNATPNILVNLPADLAARQQLQAGDIANQQNALALDYAQQTQPAKINALMSAIGAASGQDQGASPPAQSQSAAPHPNNLVPGGPSMMYGDTPVSADVDTQNAVRAEAQKAGMNPEWAARVQYAETGGVTPDKMAGVVSPAGAAGPLQLMPETAKGLGVDPTNPQQNIQGGVAYLKQMRQEFGSPVLATAAYNAGPQRVHDWLAGKGTLPTQTVDYVGKVAGNGDGMSLLNDALAGYHGSIPNHDSDMGNGMFKPPGTGLQVAPGSDDPVARASVRQLMARQQLAMLNGDMRAAAQFEQRLDNIAGPGGAIAPDGTIHIVPGSLSTRYQAKQAEAAATVGPEIAKNQANTTFNQAAEQQTHAVNAGVDTREAALRPLKVSPGEQVITPATVGVGAADGSAAGSSQPFVDPGADPTQAASPTLAAPQNAGQPGVPAQPGVYRVPPAPVNVPAVQTEIYKEDRAELDPVLQAGQDAQTAQIRTRELRDDFAKNYSGGSAPSRVALQNFVQSNFPSAAADYAKKITGVDDLGAAQEAAKLALVNAGNQERGTLGARGSLGAINLYKDANPNISLQPDAIRRISNMQLIAQQADADYAQAAAQHVNAQGQSLLKGGGYQPLDQFKQAWQAGRPSQVYAAAMSAVNGDPFEKWSKNLSPAEGQRVVGILTRADPGAPIQWKGGQTFHVPSGAAQ